MEIFVGTILPVAIDYAPRGWALCDGRLLSVTQYSALYSLIGNTYGGSTVSFRVPDLCGRGPRGVGLTMAGPSLNALKPGEAGGSPTALMGKEHMPAHTHIVTQRDPIQATAGLKVSKDLATSSTPSAVLSAAMLPATLKAQDSGGGNDPNIYGYAPDSGNVTSIPAVSLPNLSFNIKNDLNGGGQPFDVMNPYLAVYYIIATSGIMPLRKQH